jgi:membrane protease subunit HflK
VKVRYVVGLIALLFLGSILTALTQVHAGERAVVRRFGKVVATPGPGLFIGLPWGLDRVDRVPVDRVRRVAVGYQPDEDEAGTPPGQLLTGDHNLVNVRVVVHYTVDEGDLVAFAEQADRADGLVARAAESAVAEWVAGRGIDDVLVHGKAELPPAVVRQTQELLGTYHLGVAVHDADVAYLLPPREVKAAFDEVNRAQASIQTLRENALQDASRWRREARTQQYQLEHDAEAYVAEGLRRARAEAGRFTTRLEQYRRLKQENPNVLAAVWWEEMGQLLDRLKAGGRIDLLDNHLGPDGLDVFMAPPMPGKKDPGR